MKLSKAAGILYKLKKCAPISVLKLVYYSIVDSHLRYGITTWGSAKSTALDRLVSIQNKIIKYMKNIDETLEQAFSSLKILNINNLFKFEVNKLVFLMQHGSVPDAFKDFIHSINHTYGTRSRNAGNLDIPRPNTERDKTSIKYQGAMNWNSLPVSLKLCSSKEKFLGLLKDFFLDNINSSQS